LSPAASASLAYYFSVLPREGMGAWRGGATLLVAVTLLK